jgi:hypothetical protein
MRSSKDEGGKQAAYQRNLHAKASIADIATQEENVSVGGRNSLMVYMPAIFLQPYNCIWITLIVFQTPFESSVVLA